MSPIAPLTLSPQVIASLDGMALRDISTKLVMAGQPREAWELLESVGQLTSVLYEVGEYLTRNAKVLGIDPQRRLELMLPLAPWIMSNMAKGGEDCLSSRMEHWLSEPAPFAQAMRSSAHGALLPQLVLDHMAREHRFTSYDVGVWRRSANMLRVMPELWAPAITACAQRPENLNEGRVGSPGLRVAATMELDEFELCLDALARMGLDPEACCAQRWPEKNLRFLSPHLVEANALFEAIWAGNAPVARRIMELCPQMDPLLEAILISERCMALGASDAKSAQQYERISYSSQALAEALELGRAAVLPAKARDMSRSVAL